MKVNEPKTLPDPAKIRETKEKAYTRNMDMMRAYLSAHACAECGLSLPDFAMTFEKKPGEDSVSRIAGSRVAAEVLAEAMQSRRVLCKKCAKK